MLFYRQIIALVLFLTATRFVFAMNIEPIRTVNGMGVNFLDLGDFEKSFIADCRKIKRIKSSRVLFNAAAMGRLPLDILNKIPGKSIYFINELDQRNLKVFESNIEAFQISKSKALRRIPPRVRTFVGDCLELDLRDDFLSELPGHSSYEAFDLIMGDNFLHFLDGPSVFDFLIQSFNHLKPGGKLYIFGFSGRDLGPDECSSASIKLRKISYELSRLAQEQGYLFPGLFNDRWISSQPVMQDIVESGLSNKRLVNPLSLTTLTKLAKSIGFNIDMSARYGQEYTNTDSSMKIEFIKNSAYADYLGLILSKPQNYEGGPKDSSMIDPDLVKCIKRAHRRMKRFIKQEVQLSQEYPYVHRRDLR